MARPIFSTAAQSYFTTSAQSYFSDTAADNAANNFATESFFDFSEQSFDFSDASFVAISLESTSNARGGNGGGRGNNNNDPVDDSGSSNDPVEIYVSGSDGGAGYNIEIQFMGDGWTNYFMAAFKQSAEFLSAVIASERPDYIAADDPNNFFNQDIDDIMITATLSHIDGESGILGQAGPTHLIYDPSAGEVKEEALPFAGIMEFDVADAQNFYDAGTWGDIVFHEMMHTLGFGTLWERTGVVEVTIDDNQTKRPVDDTYVYDYNGEFASFFTDDPLTEEILESPVIETDGGSGTAGGHWDEETYTNELMTGFIDSSNELSKMSIASLADIGYDILWNSSEYTLLV